MAKKEKHKESAGEKKEVEEGKPVEKKEGLKEKKTEKVKGTKEVKPREEKKEEPKEEKKKDKKDEEKGEETIYTINLSRIYETKPRYRRSSKAVQEIKRFLMRHTHSSNIRIDHSLNELIWKRGSKKPPRRVQIRAIKTEEAVTASLLK
jgi:large subunit ribosomal protein L31e